MITTQLKPSEFRSGNVVVDIETLTARAENTVDLDPSPHVSLSPTEFLLLYYLGNRPGQVIHRSILSRLYYPNKSRTLRIVDVNVRRLRIKLGWNVQSVEGKGYKVPV